MTKDNYADEFLACQNTMKDLLAKCPQGIQNWSIQKTINFKKQVKKIEALIKLKPASKHTDYLKMENGLRQLQEFYK